MQHRHALDWTALKNAIERSKIHTLFRVFMEGQQEARESSFHLVEIIR